MQLTKLALAVGVAFGGALILHGCGGGGGSTTTTTTTTTTTQVQALSTPIAVQVVDSKGAPVTSTVFTVTITGANANQVVDSTGKAVTTSLSTSDGALVLGLSSSATPTTSAPVVFNILISATGYLATGQTVTVTATGSQINVAIPVVAVTTGTAVAQTDGSTQAPITNTASGVTGTQTVYPTTAVSSSGTTTQALTIGTDTTGSTASSSTTLAVPAGTTMTDASGKPITGAITANVVSYDPSQATSLAAFPGGYAATVSTGSGTTSGTFQTVGFTQINLTDSNGNTVKNFSPAISATMVIPKGTINPVTGKTMAVGDTLGIYSYDESTGTWKQESGTGTVTGTDASGNFILTFSVTHLSYYNSGTVTTSCNTAFKVVLASSLPSTTSVDLAVSGSGYVVGGLATAATNYPLNGAPQAKALTVIAAIAGTTLSKTFSYSDICSAGNPITLDLSSLVPPAPGTLSGHLYEACFDSTGKPIASTQRGLAGATKVYQSSTGYLNGVTAKTDGSYSYSLQAGTYSWTGTAPANGDTVPGSTNTSTTSNVSVTSGATTTKDFTFQIPAANCKTTTSTGGTTP